MKTCEACGKEFEAATTRRTCSRSCAVALSWRRMDTREKRIAGIKADRAIPERMEILRQTNDRRWAKAEEHAKLSEWNRARWADPEIKKDLSKRISAAQLAIRDRHSANRTAAWRDPSIRARMMAGMARRWTPELRAWFSLALAARWRDPVLRLKYLAAVRRTAANMKGKRRLRVAPLMVVDIMMPAAKAHMTLAEIRAERQAVSNNKWRWFQMSKKVRPMTKEETRRLVEQSGVVVKRYPIGASLDWKPSWME